MGDSIERQRVVLVDDEEGLVRTLTLALEKAGFEVQGFTEAVDALHAAKDPAVDVVISDLNLPHLTALDLLRELRQAGSLAEFIVITGQGTVPSAFEAVKLGAYDYISKPFDLQDVVTAVARGAERRRLVRRNAELEQMVTSSGVNDFVGESPRMRELFQLLERVAQSDSTVLIQGESGTGKEHVARALHQKSNRRARPFVALNCAALPETLLESELFGHARGAFTGAAAAKKGLFEAADGGTLFLDEIGDMPASTQVRLLRVLQEGEVRPVGSVETVKVNVRVLAASHVDLDNARVTGRFREDLYYRLAVITLKVPPLRERASDVPLLAHHFLRVYGARLGKPGMRLAGDAVGALMRYGWPGNVRELENIVQRAVVLAPSDEIGINELPPAVVAQTRGGEDDAAALAHLPYAQAKRLTVGAFDRRYLTAVLRKARGNISGAAQLADLDRSNFRRLLKQYAITPVRDSNSGVGAGMDHAAQKGEPATGLTHDDLGALDDDPVEVSPTEAGLRS
jgi:two-component system response regulator HydG